jgi:hypothetical protein
VTWLTLVSLFLVQVNNFSSQMIAEAAGATLKHYPMEVMECATAVAWNVVIACSFNYLQASIGRGLLAAEVFPDGVF